MQVYVFDSAGNAKLVPYNEAVAQIKANQVHAGKPGVNKYGTPWHACHGYRHDAHYWAWVGTKTSIYA